MRNSKKQEKPNNIKAKEFLAKGWWPTCPGGWRRGGRTSRKTRLQQRKKAAAATPSQPTTLISFTQCRGRWGAQREQERENEREIPVKGAPWGKKGGTAGHHNRCPQTWWVSPRARLPSFSLALLLSHQQVAQLWVGLIRGMVGRWVARGV